MKSTITPSNTWSRLGLLLATVSIAAVPDLSHGQAPVQTNNGDAAVEEADYRPKKYSALRYSRTVSESPFEREILPPAAPAPPPKKDPFDFKLVSVSGEGDNYRVIVIDKKGKYSVITSTPDKEGFHYSSIEPAPNIQDVRVVVSNGSQTEEVLFDTKRFSIASKAAAPQAPANTRGRPAVVPNPRSTPPSRDRGAPTPRTPIPPSKAATATSQRSGQAASAAIQNANAAAIKASQEKARVSGRRVVLPPKSR